MPNTALVSSSHTRSRKGAREATRLLDAATTVLARDGFGGATLGRIAAEADVDKRMILYYFGSRETLLVEVVSRVGERIAENMASAVEQLSEPQALADIGIDLLWQCSTEEPELLRAYFALLSSAAQTGEVNDALLELKQRFAVLFDGLIDSLATRGYTLSLDRDVYLAVVIAMWRGTALEWIEVGNTPAIQGAVNEFKRIATAPFAQASA